jgi:hypothetical protein
MTWGLARRTSVASGGHAGESLGFAAKMVGIGLCAGLALVSCQFLIDALFHTLH